MTCCYDANHWWPLYVYRKRADGCSLIRKILGPEKRSEPILLQYLNKPSAKPYKS